MLIELSNLEDARLDIYRDVRHAGVAEESPRFIAEGENVVRRLIASTHPCESVLCTSKKALALAEIASPATQVFALPEKVVNDLVGYKFHSGVMACGLRQPALTLSQLLESAADPMTLVVLPEISDSANLGAIIRVAAAFGVTGILLGEQCRDPFIRQTIRTSMGTIFSMPLVRSQRIVDDLAMLKSHGFETIATVLDADATSLDQAQRPQRLALLLGNEGPGLPREIVDQCDRRVTIPMQLGTDSLNVVTASAVFLYHFTRAG